MYAITGATGQLGRLVIDELSKKVPADQIVAAARKPDGLNEFAESGVQVREADYDRPDTLATAFQDVEKLLLISSSEVGKRTPQHRAAVEAAKAAGVKLIAYTSILHAETSPMILSPEHRETEAAIAESGLPCVFLRNGWYSENHLMGLRAALEHGAVLGAAKDGRIASASRADYAAAAVAVLIAEDQAGKVYELAGDDAWTLRDLAAEIERSAGKPVIYRDMLEEAYASILKQAGLPAPLAELFADADVGASKGALFDDSRTLSRLIGRPTTPLHQSVNAALKAQG